LSLEGMVSTHEDPKRRKVDLSPLNQEVLTPTGREQLREKFAGAKPFPHGVIAPICEEEAFSAINEEMKEGLRCTFKESDLFKLYQTQDLSGMQDDPQFKGLIQLRNAIYSETFRAFISEVAQCGPLTDRVDLAASTYTDGCHLLCHDDVIGTRKISFILYFSDNSEVWTKEDGGALELYGQQPGAPEGVPEQIPSASVLPTWNSMAFFTVQPGVSFHAVQEVFAVEKPRLSVQGWFHAAEPPAKATLATLAQITAMATKVPDFSVNWSAPEVPLSAALSAEDKAFLSQWMDDQYLQQENLEAISARFEQDSSVELRSFLKESRAAPVAEAVRARDVKDGFGGTPPYPYDTGVGEGWKLSGVPHLGRNLNFEANGVTDAVGTQMTDIKTSLFETAAFGRWLKAATSLTCIGHRGEVRRFRPGLDYTVATHGQMTQGDSVLDCTWTMVYAGADDQSDEQALWDTGEVGGFEAYIGTDESGESAQAAEVYRADDDDGPLVSIHAAPNNLSLVMRDQGTMRFVKYVSGRAPGSRFDISQVYSIEQPESSEEGEEDDEPESEGEGAEQ